MKDLRFYQLAIPQAYLESVAPVGQGGPAQAGAFLHHRRRRIGDGAGSFLYTLQHDSGWAAGVVAGQGAGLRGEWFRDDDWLVGADLVLMF